MIREILQLLLPPAWRYRNAANRTCSRCGINQMLYANPWGGGETWEANMGCDEPCSCSRKLFQPKEGKRDE